MTALLKGGRHRRAKALGTNRYSNDSAGKESEPRLTTEKIKLVREHGYQPLPNNSLKCDFNQITELLNGVVK